MIQEIDTQIKAAMRTKNATQLNVLRALKNAITNASLQKGNIQEPLSDMEILGIVRKQVSQREDSIEQFQKANRQDLIVKEREEIEILKQFLPQELSEVEIEDLIQRAIQESEAVSKKDMGKAIKKAQELANGRVENKVISKRIGEILQ